MWDLDGECERARRALDHWSGYPVHADPRRLVLTGQTTLVGAGFPSNDAKQAFLAGGFETAASVPDEVLHALSRHHGHAHGQSLRVTGAERTSATFDTDRGPRELPAWRVQIDGMDGPVSVLDPVAERFTTLRSASAGDGLQARVLRSRLRPLKQRTVAGMRAAAGAIRPPPRWRRR
jgi:hypothetical protein